jgi:uncharacterized protein (DUF433 family)
LSNLSKSFIVTEAEGDLSTYEEQRGNGDMNTTIQISAEAYELLRRRAEEMKTTPEQMAETAIRLQLGNTIHIEQRQTRSGPQAYIRDTRVAVRHVAAFLKAGHTAEEIIQVSLPHLSPAAIYEAIAYYHDNQAEIEAELQASSREAVQEQLRQHLSSEQYAALTGQAG